MPSNSYPTSGPVRHGGRLSRQSGAVAFPRPRDIFRMPEIGPPPKAVWRSLPLLGALLLAYDTIEGQLGPTISDFVVPGGWILCYTCPSNFKVITGWRTPGNAAACPPPVCAEGQVIGAYDPTKTGLVLAQDSTLFPGVRWHTLRYYRRPVGAAKPHPYWVPAVRIPIFGMVKTWNPDLVMPGDDTKPMALPFMAMPYVPDSPVRITGGGTQGNIWTGTSVQVWPVPRTLPRTDAHAVSPPKPRTKEVKLRMTGAAMRAARVLRWILNTATESADFIMSFWKAIPAKDRWRFVNDFKARHNGRYPKLHEQAWFVYENWNKLDMEKAIRNLINNQMEDFVIGLKGRVSRDAVQGLAAAGVWRVPFGIGFGGSVRRGTAPKGGDVPIPKFGKNWELGWAGQ